MSALKVKAPCPTHPDKKRYSNGACSGCAIEAQKQRYRENADAVKAYAREHAKSYVRPRMTEAERLAYNAKRRQQYQARKAS